MPVDRSSHYRSVDGLVNPKTYHRPTPPKRASRRLLVSGIASFLVALVVIVVAAPTVRSFTRQFDIYELLTNGRYLVLFQNDAEMRASGGFIGSFAIIESKQQTIKPLYFETNIYKLDTPYTLTNHLTPPKPLQAAIGSGGWALRDSNFAADFRQSAPTVSWFFDQEARNVTGQKRADIDKALGNNYQVDGVVGITMSAFLDILKATGPIEVPKQNVVVNADNFFSIVQQVVEKDYFATDAGVATNEPKTILQDLFPIALAKAQSLPKTQLYKLASSLLDQKKVIIYANDAEKEDSLVQLGWAGSLNASADNQPKGKSDFLAVVRSSHGGNKSSQDINPIYRYNLGKPAEGFQPVSLEITFEHTGTGEWPSGVNHEYLRVLAPESTTLISASQSGQDVTSLIDVGHELDKRAFGFWMHTEPKTSQSITLEYKIPQTDLPTGYQLLLWRQPGGNAPDVTVSKQESILFQGRLTTDRLVKS